MPIKQIDQTAAPPVSWYISCTKAPSILIPLVVTWNNCGYFVRGSPLRVPSDGQSVHPAFRWSRSTSSPDFLPTFLHVPLDWNASVCVLQLYQPFLSLSQLEILISTIFYTVWVDAHMDWFLIRCLVAATSPKTSLDGKIYNQTIYMFFSRLANGNKRIAFFAWRFDIVKSGMERMIRLRRMAFPRTRSRRHSQLRRSTTQLSGHLLRRCPGSSRNKRSSQILVVCRQELIASAESNNQNQSIPLSPMWTLSRSFSHPIVFVYFSLY